MLAWQGPWSVEIPRNTDKGTFYLQRFDDYDRISASESPAKQYLESISMNSTKDLQEKLTSNTWKCAIM